jgi:menaquinone-dependent protoporphyrinogen IX oxidase
MYMYRTLIVYDSKYGSTEETARKLALILGPARCIKPADFTVEFGNQFDFVVMAIPVYNEKPYPTLAAFVEKHRDWLNNKRTALFTVSLTTSDRALHYLEGMAKMLGNNCVYKGWVGGRLVLGELDAPDLKIIKSFYGTIGQEAKDTDAFKLDQFLKMALAIKACGEAGLKVLPPAEVKAAIEDFLQKHNTGALCTGHREIVRATPIEYRYQDGHCYFMTEGGEKFAGILANRQVNIAVFDPYKGPSTVAGMVLTGEVTDILSDPLSEDYKKVCIPWKFNPQKLATARPYVLNGLVVKLSKAEFFWAGFEQAGSYIKQFYRF